jgi:hypothetical protein
MKIAELKKMLSDREDSIQTPELDAVMDEYENLYKKIRELENKYANELKLKCILNREYINLMKEKRVNAPESTERWIKTVLEVKPEEVDSFIENENYGIEKKSWQVI